MKSEGTGLGGSDCRGLGSAGLEESAEGFCSVEDLGRLEVC